MATAGSSLLRGWWPTIAAGVAAVALASFVAADVLVASLDRVVRSPQRFGAWWDGDFGDYSDPDSFAFGAQLLGADSDIDALAGYTSQSDLAVVNDRAVSLAAYWPVKGIAEPTLVRGRSPQRSDEIALGQKVLEDLGLDLGDNVSLSSAQVGSAVTDRVLTVTGVVLFNDPVASTADLGEGAFVSPELLDELSPGGPQRLLARFADGVSSEQVIERLARDFPGQIRTPAPPVDVRNLQHLWLLPWLLALLVAAVASVTFVHALIVVLHERQRDLAVFAVLGMSRRGIHRVTAWSTVMLVATATVAGLPVGLVLGRHLWGSLAAGAGLMRQPAGTWYRPLILTLGMLLAAQVITLVTTSRLVSRRPADHLRSA